MYVYVSTEDVRLNHEVGLCVVHGHAVHAQEVRQQGARAPLNYVLTGGQRDRGVRHSQQCPRQWNK